MDRQRPLQERRVNSAAMAEPIKPLKAVEQRVDPEAEIAQRDEEILRLRDLLIARDAELGQVRGQLKVIEDHSERMARLVGTDPAARPRLARRRPAEADLRPPRLGAVAAPRFSIVTPVYETPTEVLWLTIESVLGQSFDDWELCLVDDCSPSPRVRELLDACAARWTRGSGSSTGPRTAASSPPRTRALAMASGEFVALLDHDDRLHPDALELVDEAIRGNPEADYVYTDEDKIDRQGPSCRALPEARLVAGADADADVHLPPERAAALAGRGGRRLRRRVRGRPGLGPGPQGDRAGAAPSSTCRGVLYHWRGIEGSTAAAADDGGGEEAKPWAFEAGTRAIAGALRADRRAGDGRCGTPTTPASTT